jgi:hypothetical protein
VGTVSEERDAYLDALAFVMASRCGDRDAMRVILDANNDQEYMECLIGGLSGLALEVLETNYDDVDQVLATLRRNVLQHP